jgi:uncharacterized protein (DUF1810 family)
VTAQVHVYESALAELRAGQKTGHWMWFIFPQVAGLGSSPTAAHYAIRSAAEAREYLAHSVLGARLREATTAVIAVEGRSAAEIFGWPDEMKFRSSMTLFRLAAGTEDGRIFEEALKKYFGGERDARTVELLKGA